MSYIPRRSLRKALRIGFILLSVFFTCQITERQLESIFIVQAASQNPTPKIFLQEPEPEPENDYAVYLPAVTQPARVELTEVWTADEFRTPREAFLPGKVIRHYVKGYVNISEAALIRLMWSVDGPCGSNTLFEGTGQIDQGLWTLFQTDIAPNCPGVYTYTLQMAYQDEVTIDTASYVVNHPSEVVSLSLQGFDKCNIPYGSKADSINQMQTWWNLSPYYSINLYMGGVSRYCTNTELDAVWVNQVAKQGWSFIPTWVGPQAPCSSYRYRISPSTYTAYQQGISEATAAYEAAKNLGLLGNTVIYYDMEMYSTTNLTCRDAVNSFLAGWSQKLLENGVRSGVYGHRVNVNDWATIGYPGTPNNVWVASWIRSTYDPYVTAYGITGISDNLWRDQRIRQYAGDHAEYYGGIGFGIDSNIMDGEVTVLPNPELSASVLIDREAAIDLSSQPTNTSLMENKHVQDMQLVTDKLGWVILDQRILWTNSGGDAWVDITPTSAAPGSILAARFIDESNGWSVSQDPFTGEMNVLITNNSGVDWRTSSLIEGDAGIGPLASAVYLELLDDQTGWVVVKLVSSANFSTGRLFHTRDGGKSWEEFGLPFGAPIMFVDQERGWLAGGPAGNQLFSTYDGGKTWQGQDIASSLPHPIEGVTIGLPEFKDGLNAVLPVKYYASEAGQLDFLATHDGGSTWQFGSPMVADGPGLSVASVQAAASLDTNLPAGAVKLEIKAAGNGWVHIERTECSGTKTAPQSAHSQETGSFHCEKQSSILSTVDGGETWVDITP